MGYKLQIGEILAKLATFKGKDSTKEKVKWLHQNDSITLRVILEHAFSPKVVYKLPEGDPPYNAQAVPVGLTENSLFSETRRMAYIWHNPPPGLSKVKHEALFISMLESLHQDDAKIMLAVKSKTLHKLFPGLTADVVKKAFPALLS